MIRGFISGLGLIVVGLGIYLFFHLGFLRSVTLKEENRKSLYLMYLSHLGAYEQVSFIITDAEKAAVAKKISCEQTFAQFFDDPEITDQDRLRSRAGCLTKNLLQEPPDGWKVEEIPSQKYLVVTFEGSPAIGPWKVYPKAKEYFVEHRLTSDGTTIEIYTIHDDAMTTEYLFPIK
jgi:AraC family transcriptional regulator